jgi:two-component system, LytTR family, sensor kinase
MSPTDPGWSLSVPVEVVTPRSGRAWMWIVYLLAWLLLGLWLGVNVVLSHRQMNRPIPIWEPLTWEISSALTMAVLAVLVYRFEALFPLSGAGWVRRLPWHLPGLLAFSALHTLMMVTLRKIVYALAGSVYQFGDFLFGFIYELQKDLISYATFIAVCIGVRALRQRREREIALARVERDLADARLAQLTAQIEPHFVFNTLNAISNRMHEDIEAADRMITDFALILRASLQDTGSPHVRVADDIEWLQRYLNLMGERYRGRLLTRITVEDSVKAASIPRLLLQPLVENAFRHGLRSGGGRIDVRISAKGDRLCCEIDDDGVGLAADFQPGVGLANVRRRLELLYPAQHEFSLSARAGGGTRVEIAIPLRAYA